MNKPRNQRVIIVNSVVIAEPRIAVVVDERDEAQVRAVHVSGAIRRDRDAARTRQRESESIRLIVIGDILRVNVMPGEEIPYPVVDVHDEYRAFLVRMEVVDVAVVDEMAADEVLDPEALAGRQRVIHARRGGYYETLYRTPIERGWGADGQVRS